MASLRDRHGAKESSTTGSEHSLQFVPLATAEGQGSEMAHMPGIPAPDLDGDTGPEALIALLLWFLCYQDFLGSQQQPPAALSLPAEPCLLLGHFLPSLSR